MNNNESALFGFIQETCAPHSLTRYMALTEAEKAAVGKTLIDQIYVTIAEKYNAIDFGSIPKSNGKISSMSEYSNLKASITLLEKIALDTNQELPEIKTLSLALANLEKMSEQFYMGFVRNNAQLVMTYNLLAMSVYCGTSLMISVLVDYVNLANTDTVQVILNKKYSKSNSCLMINALNSFNDSVSNGTFGAFVLNAIKPAPLKESVTLTVSLVIAGIILLFKIVPITKELIYIYYYSRMKLAEATAIQADLVTANLESIKSSGTATPKMVKIQSWFADKLTRLTQVFAIKYEKSENEASKEIKRKLTKDEVTLF